MTYSIVVSMNKKSTHESRHSQNEFTTREALGNRFIGFLMAIAILFAHEPFHFFTILKKPPLRGHSSPFDRITVELKLSVSV
jgi:hypothetical protein